MYKRRSRGESQCTREEAKVRVIAVEKKHR
jgi:hypothetical protein